MLKQMSICINSKWLDEIALQNKEEFLQIIQQSFHDALLLFGHVHQDDAGHV